MASKLVKSLGFVTKTAQSLGSGNPYIAALTTAIDIGSKVVQRRSDKELDRVDAMANDFNILSVTLESASTDVSVEHGLDRVPDGFQVEGRTSEVQVFTTASDNRTITFQGVNGTFPTTVRVRVY